MSTAQRLKLIRTAQERELTDVARATEIAGAELAAFEKGEKEPEPEQLWDLAVEYDTEFGFFTREIDVPDIAPASAESLENLSETERAIVTAQARVWLERYLDIESFFPIEELPLFTHPEGFPMAVASPKDAADAGEQLRLAWQLAYHPVANLADLLEVMGIRVGMIEGVSSFDAAMFRTTDDLNFPVLVVDVDIAGDAQRFAMARELAHLMLEGDKSGMANHFAGAFLAPSQVLRQAMGTSRTDIELYELQLLKQRYGVSMRTLLLRLATLKIINKDTLNAWLEVAKDGNWADAEPGYEVPSELPARWLHLVLRLQTEGHVTRDRAAELMGLPSDVWDALLDYDEIEVEDEEVS